jgi:serine/threonine protein kinase
MNKTIFKRFLLYSILIFNINAQIKIDPVVQLAGKESFLLERLLPKEFLVLGEICIGAEKFGCPVEVYGDKGKLELFKFAYRRDKSKLRIEDCFGFDQEYSLLSELNHPNIIKLVKFFPDDLVIYEELGSCNLFQYIQRIKKIKDETIKRKRIFNIIFQITQGLNYLHKNNYVHCDLKTENVVVFRNKPFRIALIDFSRALKIKNRETFIFLDKVDSTPLFTSNSIIQEFYKYKKCIYDFRDDIYSLGMIIYELIYYSKPLIFKQADDFLFNSIRDFNFLEYRKTSKDKPEKQKILLDFNWKPEIDDVEEPYFEFFNNLILRCLDIDRNLRPFAEEILRELSCAKVRLF